MVTTRGGARAMLDHRVGEVMHPVVGPAVEAERLYCGPARLREWLAEPASDALVVWDVGLGAGSNAIAAWRLSEAMPPSGRRMEIVSFEWQLDALTLAIHPDHAAEFGLEGAAGEAAAALLDAGRHVTERTTWRLVEGVLPDTLGTEPAATADVVFWDLYSPRANPGLWSWAAFTALRRGCRAGATVQTYAGATAARSALLLGGFAVGIGEETGRNKYATCAAVDAADLGHPLDRRWLERLARSSAPFPVDAPPDALARITAMPQFGGA